MISGNLGSFEYLSCLLRFQLYRKGFQVLLWTRLCVPEVNTSLAGKVQDFETRLDPAFVGRSSSEVLMHQYLFLSVVFDAIGPILSQLLFIELPTIPRYKLPVLGPQWF